MPFLPLHDGNPLRIIPFQATTIGLIVLCLAIAFMQGSLTEPETVRFFLTFGLVPAVLTGAEGLPPAYAVNLDGLTLVSHIFVHGDFWHLAGNMLFLWVFGDNVEDAMGHARFLGFFLLCGIVAALTDVAVIPGSAVPAVGASGAVSGVLGAYLLLHPKVRVLVLVFRYFPIRLPAYFLLLAWIAINVWNAVAGRPDAAGIAWWAHIGGFAAGMALIVPFRYKHVPLFDRGITRQPGSDARP